MPRLPRLDLAALGDDGRVARARLGEHVVDVVEARARAVPRPDRVALAVVVERGIELAPQAVEHAEIGQRDADGVDAEHEGHVAPPGVPAVAAALHGRVRAEDQQVVLVVARGVARARQEAERDRRAAREHAERQEQRRVGALAVDLRAAVQSGRGRAPRGRHQRDDAEPRERRERRRHELVEVAEAPEALHGHPGQQIEVQVVGPGHDRQQPRRERDVREAPGHRADDLEEAEHDLDLDEPGRRRAARLGLLLGEVVLAARDQHVESILQPRDGAHAEPGPVGDERQDHGQQEAEGDELPRRFRDVHGRRRALEAAVERGVVEVVRRARAAEHALVAVAACCRVFLN